MPSVQTLLTQRVAAAIAAALGPEAERTDPLVRPSTSDRFGDYQANFAMALAKQLKLRPRDVAAQVVAKLEVSDVCAKPPEVAGPGFINLFLSDPFLAREARGLAEDPRLGVPVAAQPRTVVVDYSGPNVAKEMHVGHLRSTVIGDALSRVLEHVGHRVVRQNHLGDWGTQFGMLIEHMRDEGWEATGSHTVADLDALYRQAQRKFEPDAAFADRARRRVVALQAGDEPTLALWRALIEESKRHFRAAYDRLGVRLTDADIRAESFYNPLLPQVVDELQTLGLARESDGALCVFPPGFKGPEGKDLPVIIRKSGGGFLYATTDLAALRYRVRDLHADRIVYVTDARQKQHFAMVFQVAQMAGWIDRRVRLDHVPFGTVLGEDGKPFKTRSGDTVKLADLLDEAEERALTTVTQKNPDLPVEVRHQVAHAVGIGAIKYADLCNDRVKDYVFSWDRMLAFDGNTAPYLQNAYVRIRSIFRKAGAAGFGVEVPAAELRIGQASERALVLKLLQFGPAIEGVAEALEPHRLCGYLFELAAGYHQFYENCPVLAAPDAATRASRLALCDLTARTLRQGLELLGIETVEQM